MPFFRSEAQVRRDIMMEQALGQAGKFFERLNKSPALLLLDALPEILNEKAKGGGLAEAIGRGVSALGARWSDQPDPKAASNGQEEE